jgi:hypothetical protein
MRFHVISRSFPDAYAARWRVPANASDRPMRTLIQPAIFDPHLSAEKAGFVAIDLEGINVFPDQEQAALASIDVGIDAIEKVLVDDDSVERCVSGQRRMVGIVFRQELYHARKTIPIMRKIRNVLAYFRTPGTDRILKLLIAMRQPTIPVLLIEQNG